MVGDMDIRGLFADERAEMTALLRELSEAEWDAPTLCTGRRVRELVAHLRYDSVSLTEYAGIAVRNRFCIDGVNNAMAAIGRGGHRRNCWRNSPRPRDRSRAGGPGSVSPTCSSTSRTSAARSAGAKAEVRPARPVRPHRAVYEGLQFVATDFDWVKGSGPAVRGRGEALALSMVGCPVVLDELEGEGVAELRRRCS